ncbi:hypothetical protein DSL92_08755 [Billgrantia gudaonensis]|uniref:Uncharacterized protein n=1 Tax=Billgrantia gudaonensis TaxID=376427 RepID=A0A3S0QFG1_9GAMM|nr:hypothetical protein DSL92_08755 [Halomonas gudaonensis]
MGSGVSDAKASMRLNWYSEFREPSLEALFQRTMQAHHACQLPYALWSAAGSFAFSLADYAMLGLGETYQLALAMRAWPWR